MKGQTLNGCICFVTVVVFLLQVVGYLSPAWFVQEIGFDSGDASVHIDGTRWILPGSPTNSGYKQTAADTDLRESEPEMTDLLSSFPELPDSMNPPKIVKRSALLPGSNASETRPSLAGNTSGKGIPLRLPVDNPTKTPLYVSLPDSKLEPVTMATAPSKTESSLPPMFKSIGDAIDRLEYSRVQVRECLGSICNEQTGTNKTCVNYIRMHLATSGFVIKNYNDASLTQIQARDSAAGGVDSVASKDKLTAKASQSANADSMDASDMRHFASLWVGLWYGRVCVNSLSMTSLNDVSGPHGVEWCTMYVRLNETSPEGVQDLFEVRIEASLGLGFSLLSLFASSVCCCTHRHVIKRTVLSLGLLFTSGAVMAVPVVYAILQHVTVSDVIARRRYEDMSLKTSFTKHDVFDHWSAIVCGVSSLLAIGMSLVFAGCAICCVKKPKNQYKFEQTGEQLPLEKTEVPINWLRNSKRTISSMTSLVDETKIQPEDQDTKSDGYEDLPEDNLSARDGGESLQTGAREDCIHDNEEPDVQAEDEAETNFAFEYSDQENERADV